MDGACAERIAKWSRTATLIEETPLPPRAGGAPRTLTRWREARPIPPYLMVIAAAPLVYYDLGRDGCGRRRVRRVRATVGVRVS